VTRGKRGRRWLLGALLAVVFGALLVPVLPGSASAAGCDPIKPWTCMITPNDVCDIGTPAPSRPDSGLAGWFLSEPKQAPAGDPFAPDAKVSVYDVYGYAGLDYSTYDLGCGGAVRDPQATAMNSTANLIHTPAMWLIALDNSVREYAYQPNSMWGWTNDLVAKASKALHERVFTVWGAVALLLVGLWLMWGARAGNMSQAVMTAGWAVLVMAVVTAVAAWPVKASTVADGALTGALGQISSGLSAEDPGDQPPAVRASGVLTQTVLYQQYLRGTLGSADSDVAKKYGPDLYKARSLSWAEVAEIKKDPGRRTAITDEKKKLWDDTASKIKGEDPDAYDYLTGKKGAEKVGAAILALISALVVTPFDIMASLLILVAFLIIRLAVAFLPAIGTVGILRPAAGPLRGLLRTVLAAIINCVIFGAGSAVFLLAVRIITGTDSLAGWQQILLLWLTGLILWLLLRPYRRLTQLTGIDPFAELAGGIGKMHKRVFGDMRQLAIAGAGAYLGDVAALEAHDRKHERQGERLARPESWSRGRLAQSGASEARAAAPARAADPAREAPASASAGAQRPETGAGKRTDHTVIVPAQVSSAAAQPDEPHPLPPVSRYSGESGLAEESETYVIYRPDRGYAPTTRDDGRNVRAVQAASAAANAARDVAAAVSSASRAAQAQRD
jgi:hypothetical protein